MQAKRTISGQEPSRRNSRPVIVTLIHGTWAKGARWTDPDSGFCQELRARVPGLKEILVFRWSGRNSHRAREVAAERLREFVKDIAKRFPNARHYLVAHSHGGTVVQYACQLGGLTNRIAGVACLSTPFIARRSVWAGFAKEGPFVQWGPTVGAAIGAGTVYILLSSILWTLSLPRYVAWGLIGLLGIVLATALLAPLSPLFDDLHISDKNSLPHWNTLDGVNLLIVRAPGDEASGALAAMHLMSWLSGRFHIAISKFLLAPLATVDRLFLRVASHLSERAMVIAIYGVLIASTVLGIIGAFFIAGMMLGALGVPLWVGFAEVPASQAYRWLEVLTVPARFELSTSEWLAWVARIGILLVALPLAIFSVLGLLFACVVWLCGIPFGFVYPELLPESFLTVEPCPQGRWTVHQLREPDLYERDGGLSHSETYSNPEAIGVVADWLVTSSRQAATT